ncbi:uncharacterized protein PpBr36_11179 [Pyricularia pennisetigena]|uniref:uncharacterized protein n=1 Tax=Pyricularia pennisetigena TaxID=1578925 RepID=UPI0011503F2A|nr:uncharacterized protein PpBr36_11179 [Pyricularia pennisetigena]TLS20495.1 hypothetical protein PpBr36_11179 [Pyricularia pennisetigena]
MEGEILHDFRITHSYSENHDAENTITGEKVSLRLSPKKHRLEGEISAYKSLAGGIGIPFFDSEGSLIVTTRLGPTLENLFEKCGRQLSLKSILLIADQVISRLELMHGRSLVHGDIKPDNFRIGIGKQGNVIHVTGLSSASAINGTSWRHDMEALGRMLVYFGGGKTWLELVETPLETLCDGLPEAFLYYFGQLRSSGSERKPDYELLRRKFQKLYTDSKYPHDFVFDWTLIRYNSSNIGSIDNGQRFAEQPEYAPISQHELKTKVVEISNSLQDLETKFEKDYARDPLSIRQQQFRELLDEYIDWAWALDRVSHKRPRPSNDDIAKSIWTIIERIFGLPGMKSDQQLAFFRSAYSTLAVLYVTVSASETIWALYLKKISERGAEFDSACRQAWDITSEEWAKTSKS